MDDRIPRMDVGRDVMPRWVVVLHNDDFNTMPYVVTCLLNTVNGLSEQHAIQIVQEVHERGQAEVVSCPLELAEFYRERLESLVLTATIETA